MQNKSISIRSKLIESTVPACILWNFKDKLNAIEIMACPVILLPVWVLM